MGTSRRMGIASVAATITFLPALLLPASASAATDGPPTWRQRCTVDAGPVHFRTPETAMRYLAAAWNCRDSRALAHVTDPDARGQLQWMTTEAVNLQFVSCTDYGSPGRHVYGCEFTHDYPKGVPHETPTPGGKGHASLVIKPARNPGWYATVAHCG